MVSQHLLEERYRALSPLLDQCSAGIASQNLDVVESSLADMDDILAEIEKLSVMVNDSPVSPNHSAAAEGVATVIQAVLNEIDANRSRLEEWKSLIQALLRQLKVGGQAMDGYAAVAGRSSGQLIRVNA